MWGPSRTGKTSLSRSFGPHVFFSGMFDLAEYNKRPDVEFAVFEDLNDWKGWKSYKSWMGAQLQFTCTDKYAKKQTIMWGRPCVITMNCSPYSIQDWDMPWVEANSFIVNIHSKLF